MVEQGRKKVEVWLDARELAMITSAARAVGQTRLATWIREQAVRAAEESEREAARRRHGA